MAQRSGSHFERHEIYVVSSLLCAQAMSGSEGFRQRDIRFLIEMFSNWMDVLLKDQVLGVHNTQIMRCIRGLVKQGYAKELGRASPPRFSLTGLGIVYLLGKLAHQPPQFPLENYLFIHHFLDTYRQPILQMLEEEAKRFPASVKIEVEALLDVRRSLDDHIAFVDLQLRKLRQRIADSRFVIQMVRKMRKDGKITKDIVASIEEKFPYDLNSQKKLTEFYNEMPPSLRDWVLDVALPKRTEQIWVPMADGLERALESLKAMVEGLKKMG